MTTRRNLKQNKSKKDMMSNVKRKTNAAVGAGLKKTFKNIVSHTKSHINNLKPKCKKMLMELAYATAQELASDLPIKLPRVIPVPKTGGFLPLIPIFAGLSVAGGIADGVIGIKKAINTFKAAKQELLNSKRYDQRMESVCVGKGLHLKPYKDGLGIYVTKQKN